MTSEDARLKSPRLCRINKSSNGRFSGPFWDPSDRCFWLMNNRQIYTHSENYSGSSACATIDFANPNSAYPSGWSRSQRTRSLSGSDASPNSASHESKCIRPEPFDGVPINSTGCKQPSRQGTPEKQCKFPRYDLSNLPPALPFLPQRPQSVRFFPKIFYSDDHLKKHIPGPSTASFPKSFYSTHLNNKQDQHFSRSSNSSPSHHSSHSSHSRHNFPPTHTHPIQTSNPSSASSTLKSKSKSTSTSTSTTHRNLPPSTHYTPPKHLHDPEHEDEDLPPISSATLLHLYTKLSPSPSQSPPFRDRHESHRIRTHHRRLEYDHYTDSEIPDQKEKKLLRQKPLRERTPDEQKKCEKILKGAGETGRGEMGRAVFVGGLPVVCSLTRLAA